MNSDTPNIATPIYVDVRAAAALLGLSHTTLNTWRSRREGPPYSTLGAAVRYRIDDLKAWAEARSVNYSRKAA